MYYDKDKYEKLISDSILFSIDKDNEPTLYRREFYRMVENLYCYLLAVNERDYEPYGCEIMDVATRCINNFDSSRGVFLYYFTAAWKKQYSHIVGDAIIDQKLGGIRITEEDRRNVRKYLTLANKLNDNLSKQEVFRKISEAMAIPVDKVRLISEMSSLFISSDTQTNSNGDVIDIWEMVSDETDIEQQFEEADSIDDLLAKIERAFCELQDRQKPIISDMITIKLWPILSENMREHHYYHFISSEIVQTYSDTKSVPSQRQIADKYARDEASISRSVKAFLSKLQAILSEG